MGGERASAAAYSIMTADGVVYVSAWDGNGYAFGAGDGAPRWHAPIGGFVAAPAVVNGLVIADRCDCTPSAFDTNPNGEIFGFSTADGTVRWDVHLPVAPMGPMVMAP